MRKTNFDLYLEEQLKDPVFAERFERAAKPGMWPYNSLHSGKRRGSLKKSSPAKSEQPSNKSAGSNRPVTKVILSASGAESRAC